jgi:hypothetical protein
MNEEKAKSGKWEVRRVGNVTLEISKPKRSRRKLRRDNLNCVYRPRTVFQEPAGRPPVRAEPERIQLSDVSRFLTIWRVLMALLFATSAGVTWHASGPEKRQAQRR